MLQYDNKNWFSFIFRHGSKHVEGMWYSILFMSLLTTGLVYLNEKTEWFHIDIDASFHSVVGLVLGLLLVFRTNSAYDRWWEGRKQLGVLVNSTRNLALKIKLYVPLEKYAERNEVLDLISAFSFTLKAHLRDKDYKLVASEIPKKIKSRFDSVKHKPNYILNEIGRHLELLFRQGLISGEQLIILEKECNALINVQGACERIRNTPIPMAYALHLKRVLLMYSLSLPFVMVHKLHYWSIPIVLIIFYTMVGIELIGEEIEDPFGLDENDLPFDELCQKIKENIEEMKTY